MEEDESNLPKFEWQVLNQTSDTLTLQTYFENPRYVSSHSFEDILVIKIYDQRLFVDQNGIMIRPETEIRRPLPRQFASKEDGERASAAATAATQYL